MNQYLTNQIVNKLATKQQDMKERSIVNLAPSKNPGDAVNRSELEAVNNKLVDALTKLANIVSESGGSEGGIIVTEKTLTLANTTIQAPTSGKLWIVMISQDSAGGHAITWGPSIDYASLTIGTGPFLVSVFQFAKYSKGWVMVGQPTIGMTVL